MAVKFFVDMGREREAKEKGRRGRKGSKDHRLRRDRIKWGGSLSKPAGATAEIRGSIYTHWPVVAGTGHQKNSRASRDLRS